MPTTPEPLGLDEHGRFMWRILDELNHQTDRGTAIVGQALLDDILARVIKARFVSMPASRAKDIDQALFLGAAPLSSFSVKAHLAFAMGFISENSYRDLILINKVRRSFAHVYEPMDFSRADVASRCAELWAPAHIPIEGLEPPTTRRDQFIHAVVALADQIRDEALRREAHHQARVSQDDVLTTTEPPSSPGD